MKQSYSQRELDELVVGVAPRTGWDFSRMRAVRAQAPWEYTDVVSAALGAGDDVLDVGTGGGERFLSMIGAVRAASGGDAAHRAGLGCALGVDIDPVMIEVARENGRGVRAVSFRQSTHELEHVPETFDVIVDRHAPFSVEAVADRLRPGGRFITQQVGERNMWTVKQALGQEQVSAPISAEQFAGSALRVVDFREYDVAYTVTDVESLVFWLSALDFLHSDVDGSGALADVDVFNRILAGNVTSDGFVTNEHRYLAVLTPAL